jgi:hypothetical protein
MNSIMYWGIMNTTWHGFYTPDFRPTPWAQPVWETLAEIRRGVGPLLLHGRRDHNGIAVHYSQASLHVQTLLGGPERVQSLRASCALLEDLGLQYDLLSSQQITAGAMKDYRVLLLPYSCAIDRAEAEALRQFAASGGILLADGPVGIRDGHGKKADPPLLADVPHCPLAHPVWQYPEVRDREAGQPFREEVRGLLAQAGVRPTFRVQPEDGGRQGGVALPGCELVHWSDGPAEYLGLLQGREYLPEGEEAGVSRPVQVVLPRKYHVYSVREGEYRGYVDTIATSVEPAVAQLYALLPARIERVVLRLPAASRRGGQSVRYSLGAFTTPPRELPHVYHVEVYRPDGRLYREYGANLYSPAGEATGTFTLALNDPAGLWKMVVTDTTTGLKAAATLRVHNPVRSPAGS